MTKKMATRSLGVVFLVLIFYSLSANANRQRDEKVTIVKDPTVGSPWPLPQSYTPSSSVFTLDAGSFQFVATSYSCDILQAAFSRYRFLTFPSLATESISAKEDNTLRFQSRWESKAGDMVLNSLSVDIKSACSGMIYPSMESDESYDLAINAQGAKLTANSIWGGLRGLETFSQLVWEDDFQVYKLNHTTIHDFPRFAHRGTLVDTSRHYVSVLKIKQHLVGKLMDISYLLAKSELPFSKLPAIVHVALEKKNMEAMAQNKMNVFHWHIVDDQAFPYESYTFPAISQKASYTPDHVYTQEDVKEIIEFARVRGIRVVPEFDSPGHTESWGPGQPGLLTSCYSGGKPDGTYGPIDPSVNSSYAFLKAFFSEIKSVFPDEYVHMGGDEVSFQCWQSNPQITAFMKKMQFGTNYAKLEEYYMQNLLNIISSLQRGYIIWQEVIDNGVTVRPDTVVEVWKGGYPAELAKVTKLGYHTLLSSCWYLNYISYGSDWEAYYKCDPQNFNGTEAQKQLVIGGETCMWGEYVDDTNLISRFWPRASAVAERLWSAKTVTDLPMARRRVAEHRCRLKRRGFDAEPINGPSFCRFEVSPRH